MVDVITSVLQSEKRCIFCGNPPIDKNKEHVIPRWLIELTGDPKRTWYLGLKFDDADKPPRQFAASQFQFPACETCNSRYSGLEQRTSRSMNKLLNGDTLSAAEWDDLLDWFDKVRVGLFIGNMILNKDLPIPDPKFFIDQRVGMKDRCVLMYRIREDHSGFRMIGAGDPVFFHNPTSFMLLINKLLFVNISSDFLLAPRMGFPFPRVMKDEGPRTRADELLATYRRKLPFIRFSLYPSALAVYQCILLKDWLEDEGEYASLARGDYVQANLLTGQRVKSKLCIVREKKALFLEPSDEVPDNMLQESQNKTMDQYSLRFFEYRRAALNQALEVVQAPSKKLVRLMIKFNGYAIAQTKAGKYTI